mgnify:FL=1
MNGLSSLGKWPLLRQSCQSWSRDGPTCGRPSMQRLHGIRMSRDEGLEFTKFTTRTKFTKFTKIHLLG